MTDFQNHTVRLRLQDTDPNVRRTAVAALAKLGDAEAVPALREALQDLDWRVRRDAAAALGTLADISAVPALIAATRDKEWLVAFNARNALSILGDSFTLPRKILGDSRWSAQERIDILDDLRGAVHEVNYVTVPYRITDTRTLCEVVLAEEDEAARIGARTVLGWLGGDRYLLTPAPPGTGDEGEQLLRAAPVGPPEPRADDLLRASELPNRA